MGDTWACPVCSLRLLGAPWESLSVLGRSLGVLGRHCVLLELSLGSPGAPQNVENELGSSSGASVAGNRMKTRGFPMIFKTCQSSPRSSFGLFGGALWRPRGPGVSLESAAGRPWRRHGSPWGPLGTSLGVLKGPSGHLWECLRVPRGHLGSACGALPALKIIENLMFLLHFQLWGTLVRHLSVSGLLFGVVGCSLAVIGHSSTVLGHSLGSLGYP